jgi:hypothetical protein
MHLMTELAQVMRQIGDQHLRAPHGGERTGCNHGDPHRSVLTDAYSM